MPFGLFKRATKGSKTGCDHWLGVAPLRLLCSKSYEKLFGTRLGPFLVPSWAHLGWGQLGAMGPSWPPWGRFGTRFGHLGFVLGHAGFSSGHWLITQNNLLMCSCTSNLFSSVFLRSWLRGPYPRLSPLTRPGGMREAIESGGGL